MSHLMPTDPRDNITHWALSFIVMCKPSAAFWHLSQSVNLTRKACCKNVRRKRRSVCFPDTSSIQRCTASVQRLAVSGEMHCTRREGEPAPHVSAVIDSQRHNKFNRLQTLLKLLPVDTGSKSAECFLSWSHVMYTARPNKRETYNTSKLEWWQ